VDTRLRQGKAYLGYGTARLCLLSLLLSCPFGWERGEKRVCAGFGEVAGHLLSVKWRQRRRQRW